MKILVLHGPNLNLLGTREPDVYGSCTLADIDGELKQQAQKLSFTLETLQSDAEHELIAAIHQAPEQAFDFIIINPAAFTHTSIALRDALLAVGLPFIELHLSNVYAREAFRHRSYLADIAVGTITGFGPYSYLLALDAARHYLNK